MPPRTVGLKIEWANRHRESLIRQLESYRARKPFVVTEETGDRDGIECRIWRAHSLEPAPSDLAMTMADFIDNLRSSLDYMVGELRPDGPSKESAFPICLQAEGQSGFGHVSKRRLSDVPEGARAVIEAMQPYKNRRYPGDAWGTPQALAALETLWNVAKHRTILFGYAFLKPDRATYKRPKGDTSEPGYSLPWTDNDAEISVPIDSGISEMQVRFAIQVTLAQPQSFAEDWPLWVSGWPIEGVVDHFYHQVAGEVLSKLEPFFPPAAADDPRSA